MSHGGGVFFVAGSSASADFPTTPGAFQRELPGGGDGFVAAIADDGQLRFATLFGGSQLGHGGLFGPAVDASRTVFATARLRSRDAPPNTGAFQPEKAGGPDTGADGRLRHATFFGGSGIDNGRHPAVHSETSRVAIVGETTSTDLPETSHRRSRPVPTSPSSASCRHEGAASAKSPPVG